MTTPNDTPAPGRVTALLARACWYVEQYRTATAVALADAIRAALAAAPAVPPAQTGEDGAPPRVRPTHPLFGGYLKARATIERKGRPSADDFAALHVAEEALNDALYVRATPRAAPDGTQEVRDV